MRALTETDASRVYSAARQLTSRYRGFVEHEDVAQELWIWVLKHRAKVEQWEAEHAPKTVERLVMRSLRNAGEKYCRHEKAERSGYSPDDEFFYSIPMVADMLMLHFDPEWMAPPSNMGARDSSNKKPPQEGGNLQAMVADVGKAYAAMPQADQDLLHRIYADGRPREAIAYEAVLNEITPGAQDRRVRRVLGRLRAKLGGPAPFTETEDSDEQ